MNQKSQKKQNIYFTYIKAMCILIVLLLHSRGGWNYDDWDYFYQPNTLNYNYWLVIWQLLKPVVGVFIFLAGYFVNQETILKSPKEFYLKKCRYILIPYFIWSAIYTVNQHLRYDLAWSISDIKGFLLGQNGIQLYYVIALSQLFIAAYFIVKYFNHRIVRILCFSIALLYSIGFQIYYMITFQTTWFEMYLLFNWLFYFYLGIHVRRYPECVDQIKSSIWNILLVVAFLINLFYGFFIQAWVGTPAILLSQIGPANFFYTIAVCLWLFSHRVKGRKETTNKFLIFVGGQCYFIYLSHWLFQQYIRIWTGNQSFLTKYLPLCQIVDVCATFLACTITWYLVKFIRKYIS